MSTSRRRLLLDRYDPEHLPTLTRQDVEELKWALRDAMAWTTGLIEANSDPYGGKQTKAQLRYIREFTARNSLFKKLFPKIASDAEKEMVRR